MNRPFIKGLELSRLFYEEAVEPLLTENFPEIPHSAALLGPGSDVLGFDTPQSTDHDWGPRLKLFLSEADHEVHRDEIDRVLQDKLPREIHGYPTGFGRHEDDTAVMAAAQNGPMHHGVSILTVRGFFTRYLNYDPDGELGAVDWLTFPEQRLRSLVAGGVFHDGLHQLEPIRARLSYYPHDVWLYLLAVQWRRLSQEEHLMGRCGQVGDDLGSRLVAAHLVRDLMRLCFLMERQYAPYTKWFGTAFAQLNCAETLTPILSQVLRADTWQSREKHLSAAYEFVAAKHNSLGITEPLSARVSRFHDRPFLVINADRFADRIRGAMTSEEVRTLPENVGGIDQFVDSTDILAYPERIDLLRSVYQ
jgi:hypothetical protein